MYIAYTTVQKFESNEEFQIISSKVIYFNLIKDFLFRAKIRLFLKFFTIYTNVNVNKISGKKRLKFYKKVLF